MPEFGSAHLIPPPYHGSISAAGQMVTSETATGLAAVGRAIRLVCGLVGVAPLSVFTGRKGDRRELPDSEQAALFRDPYPGMSAYDWRYDVALSLEVSENAFLRKIRTTRGKLVALQPIPPKYVNAQVDDNGEKTYEVSTRAGFQTVPAREILHIRGQTVDGGPFGVSRLMQHRDPLGAMLAAQRFEGAYFRNYARPDIALIYPQGVSKDQGEEWTEAWNAKFGGADNAGRAFAAGAGVQVQPIPVSMQDAQFVEARRLSNAQVAQIMDVEELLLGGAQFETQDEQAMDRFLAFQMPPRLLRITSALKADPDVFPPGAAEYPEFAADPLMFASPATRATVQHSQIQAGTLLPDEARADNGRPPLPDGLGRIPQVTPVGGAPNPDPLPAG